MKLIENFDRFLENTVNLNVSRINTLETKIETITSYLQNRPTLKKWYQKIAPQGSFKHGTIIKPPTERNEFDADVLLFLKRVDTWEPRDYIHNLYSNFRGNDLYKNIVSRKSRCVVLNYAGDFHIDIVPCVKEGDKVFVMNKDDNIEEETNPEGYIEWFKNKKALSNNNLVEVVRLLKYLRDIKITFSAKSILLTTLLGNQIKSDDREEDYCDLPTSLKTIINRLNVFLEENALMPIISNPSLPKEDFNRNWNQEKYSNFRKKISDYTTKINEAFFEESREKSIKKWKEVFGEDFPELSEENKKVTDKLKNSLVTLLNLYPASNEEFLKNKEDIKYEIEIDARVSKNNGFLDGLLSSMSVLKTEAELVYFIKTNIPFEINYILRWKVRNTGKDAKHDLRGEITDDAGCREKSETTKYVGKHYVECYAIDENDICIAKGRRIVDISFKR